MTENLTSDGLFERFASFRALREGARNAARGKRSKPAASAFLASLESEILEIETHLANGQWRPGSYVTFEVYDPKRRIVSAAPFRDRVVHHALCKTITPIFERRFIRHSYADRAGKGTHRAIAQYEHFRDRHRYVLRCDIFRYFPSVDHQILKRDIARVVHCPRTLAVIDLIIDGSNTQEPVHIHYPGDDLFEPFRRRRGIPIGNLTSQLFANAFLDPIDHLLTDRLRAPGYVRYMDDLAIFHDDRHELEAISRTLEAALAERRLSWHPRKVWIAETSAPSKFLGLELFGNGRRRIPDENVARFRNRLRGLRDRWRNGTVAEEEVRARIQSWIAHASHADSWRLRNAMFAGGWFDPIGTPSRSRTRRQ